MDKKKAPLFILPAIAVGVFVLIYFLITITGNPSGNKDGTDKAMSKLNKMTNRIQALEMEPRKSHVDLEKNNLESELPDISQSPLTVVGETPFNIEIFGSPEKTGNGYDGWLNEVAEAFNRQGIKVNGEVASVSVRSIASGLGMDYIISGKYRPDAYTPSNEMWAEMAASEGITMKLEQNRLLGNVAGIILSKQKHSLMIEKYGEVSIKTIIQATVDNEIIMGYTNPYASSTGLNFVLSTLHAYDQSNPLSNQALDGFSEFQANIPFVSYTTMQMRDAAKTGTLDGMILEYQTFINIKELGDYTFNPFGARHDNPIYSVGELSDTKKEILRAFLTFCEQENFQELATQYGFNALDTYKSDVPNYPGNTLLNAQGLWKEAKDSGKPVTAIFVADVSGSMSGEPLMELQRSLIMGSQYIGTDNYVGLVSYDSKVYVNLPIDKFDLNHRAFFKGAVEDMQAMGSTATYDAIAVAVKMLLEAKEANPDTKLMMFLLSDGETNQGHKFKDIKPILEVVDIPVYTIGYNADLQELENLSKINEATSINASSDDVVYKIKSLFNAKM